MISFGQNLPRRKTDAVSRINARVGEIRSLYITVVPGQDLLYSSKEREAIEYVRQASEGLDLMVQEPRPVPMDDFPLIEAEVGIIAPTAWEVSQIILNTAAFWRGKAAQIETARLGAIKTVENATSIQDVDTALSDFLALALE